jgi:adenosylcobinamide-phosphate synthase
MVGYKNERYRDLGWASARLDDFANLVPARVTAVLAIAAGRRSPVGMVRAWRDRVHHTSPNAGLVEAAFAQGLGVRLGGSATYGGETVDRPAVGEGFPPPRREDIARVVALSRSVGTLAVILGVALSWAATLSRMGKGRRR